MNTGAKAMRSRVMLFGTLRYFMAIREKLTYLNVAFVRRY